MYLHYIYLDISQLDHLGDMYNASYPQKTYGMDSSAVSGNHCAQGSLFVNDGLLCVNLLQHSSGNVLHHIHGRETDSHQLL